MSNKNLQCVLKIFYCTYIYFFVMVILKGNPMFLRKKIKCFVLLLSSCYMLSSCGNSSGINESIDAINTSIDALEESLPKECKTKSVELQINSLKKQIDGVEERCNVAVTKVKSEKTKWLTATIGLLTIICFYFFKKII